MADFINKPQENVQKIVEAIKSEAEEKAEQIKKNAEEQFKIQKNNIVNTEKDKIIEEYKKRLEKLIVDRRIQRSAKINEQRLEKMKARFDLIEKLKGEISNKIGQSVSDPNKYKTVFKQLIIQALIKLMEPKVELKVMKKDLQLARELKTECENEFKAIVKRECNRDFNCTVVINEHHSLEEENPQVIGGVVLTCDGGRIQVNNTLNARVDLAFQEFLPDIRRILFPSMK
ncbi:hypothetical protein ABPG74_010460 [Tetrahymena malaccensis]